ncbi:cell division protein [Bifidobacterium choerinum]|uniref:Cell division protein n=1 Tax=Bifidobacterium choerinum TaxID=35760 RepID=A0A2D3D4Y4_9BIFI|nr:cell division protein [Bifidobacterium choerinum]ATU20187.1 cell division protein [Bifidobacterium choerinum]
MTDETPVDDTDEHIPANARGRATFNMSDLPDLRDHQDGDAQQPTREQEEFTTVYDTIDAMERTLNEAKGTMFSPTLVKIDREDFLDQLQSLKAMLPVQLERASALMREAERRLEGAQSQANVIITSAQSRAADMIRDANDQVQFLTSQENITQLAREKATQMLNKAQHTSDRLTQGADRYCIGVMNDLQEQLDKLKRDVAGGLQVLEDRQQKAAQNVPHISDDDYPEA